MRRQGLSVDAERGFGDMIKAVVDVQRGCMAVGAELHSDEEAAMLEDGSQQSALWGINVYPGETGNEWVEFDSMINVRPAHSNRSRAVDDERIRALLRKMVGTDAKSVGLAKNSAACSFDETVASGSAVGLERYFVHFAFAANEPDAAGRFGGVGGSDPNVAPASRRRSSPRQK